MTDARVDQAKGDIKTAAGKVTGDHDLELEGRAQSAEAGLRKDANDMMDKTRQAAGDVMDRTKDVAGDVMDRTKEVAGDVADKTADAARQATDKAKEMLSR